MLSVKGTAAIAAVEACGDALDGKTIIDTTNPIADAPPVSGVLSFFTGPNESLMERLQGRAPKAHFVKAFSCVGNAVMVNPQLPGGRPTMFICRERRRGEGVGFAAARAARLGHEGHGGRRGGPRHAPLHAVVHPWVPEE